MIIRWRTFPSVYSCLQNNNRKNSPKRSIKAILIPRLSPKIETEKKKDQELSFSAKVSDLRPVCAPINYSLLNEESPPFFLFWSLIVAHRWGVSQHIQQAGESLTPNMR
jgi:hypothetical protein